MPLADLAKQDVPDAVLRALELTTWVQVHPASLPSLRKGTNAMRYVTGDHYGLDTQVVELAATFGAAFGFRALARQLLNIVPVLGWIVKAGVAYAGTRAIGEAAVRYCEAKTATQLQPASASASSF